VSTQNVLCQIYIWLHLACILVMSQSRFHKSVFIHPCICYSNCHHFCKQFSILPVVPRCYGIGRLSEKPHRQSPKRSLGAVVFIAASKQWPASKVHWCRKAMCGASRRFQSDNPSAVRFVGLSYQQITSSAVHATEQFHHQVCRRIWRRCLHWHRRRTERHWMKNENWVWSLINFLFCLWRIEHCMTLHLC